MSLLCFIFVITSCNEDSIMPDNDLGYSGAEVSNRATVAAPSVSAESLFVFDSLPHFKAYYDMLDDLYSQDLDFFDAIVSAGEETQFTMHARLMSLQL